MNLYLRILQFIKPYRLTVILSLMSSLFYILINSFSLWMVSSLIGTIINPNQKKDLIETSSISQKFESIIDKFIGPGDQIHQLKMFCILLLISFVLKNLFYYINNISLSYVQNNLIQDIRNSLFSHLQKLPLSFYNRNKTANISSIVLNDVSALRIAFTQSIQKLINEPLNIVVLITMLFIINIKLTIIALIILPISAFIITKLGQSIRRRAKRSSIQIAGVMNVLHETLTGIKIVKAFTKERYVSSLFKNQNFKYYKLMLKQDLIRYLNTPLNDSIGVIIGTSLLWIGGREVIIEGSLSPDDFMRFIIFLFAMLQPARKLGNVNVQIQAGLASAERIFSILDTPLNTKTIKNSKRIKSFKDKIEFQSVNFTYDGSAEKALNGINTVIQKGEIIAIVGSSGAGKSTFADLIPRFYDVDDGKILIDDININNLTLDSLRSLIGIVTQETILFNDTVLNNILYGNPKADIEDVKKAAQAANALEFIAKMEYGFDTIIGEKGTRLSGGQKQRITIARAILKNPQILILDEATSALDSESERKVQIAIDNLVKNRTVLIIAHRLSTIKNADKILVFNNGELIESGSHRLLLEKNGYYSKLYHTQSTKGK